MKTTNNAKRHARNAKRYLMAFFAAMTLALFLPTQSLMAQEDDEEQEEDLYAPRTLVAEDGFTYVKQNVRKQGIQVSSSDGKVLIPASRGFKSVRYVTHGKFFRTQVFGTLNGQHVAFIGVCRLDGSELIPCSRQYTGVRYGAKSNTYIVKRNAYSGVCDADGKELISPSRKYTDITFKADRFIVSNDKYVGLCDRATGKVLIPFSRHYDHIYYNSARKFFRVMRNKKEGACDLDGNEIVAPVWQSCIYNDKVKKWKVKKAINSQWEDL